MKKKIREKKEPFFSKKRTLTYAIGGFIILLMVASALNMNSEEEEKYDYHGLKFVQTEQGIWAAYKDNQQITLLYSPEELEKIELPANVGMMSYSQKIYISTDDIKTNAKPMDYFKRRIGITESKPYACTKDVPGCENLPLKTCEDATQSQAVVVFKRAEQTKVDYKANCLTMEGDSENLIKAIDKLYFTLAGI